MLIGTVNRYKILHQIGEGAAGKVFLASDKVLGRFVALKILGIKQRTGLRKEFLLLSGLRHPNLCQMLDFGYAKQGGRNPYLVREYVPGKDLGQLIGKVSPNLYSTITVQLLQALGYLHRQGVVHGDIKPANIILTKDNCVKLIDFNLSLSLKKADLKSYIGGTIAYLSPERLSGEKIDPDFDDDFFALGVTLFQLICGKLPVPSIPPEDIADWYRERGALSPSVFIDNIPQPLNHLVSRLTAAKCAERINNTAEALELLGETDAANPRTPGWIHFIGRKTEIDLLGNELPREAKNNKSQIVFISGPRGSGKTRLLNEIIPQIKALGFSVYSVWGGNDNPIMKLRTQVLGNKNIAVGSDIIGELIESFGSKPVCMVFDEAKLSDIDELFYRISSKTGLKVLLFATVSQGERVPELSCRKIKLSGLNLLETTAIILDYLHCGGVTDDLVEKIWKTTAGLPGPLLLLLNLGIEKRTFVVNEAGQLSLRKALPTGKATTVKIPKYLEKLFEILSLTNGPVGSEIILKALGPGGNLLIGEAEEKGFVIELRSGDKKLIAPAWGFALKIPKEKSYKTFALRLAAAYKFYNMYLSCAVILSRLGLRKRALKAAQKAFVFLRGHDPDKAIEALNIAWKYNTGRNKFLTGLRLLQFKLIRGDVHDCDKLIKKLEVKHLPNSSIPLTLNISFLALKAQVMELGRNYADAYRTLSEAISMSCGRPVLRSVTAELLALKANCAFHMERKEESNKLFSEVANSPSPVPGSVVFHFWYRAQSTAAIGLGLLGYTKKSEEMLKRLLSFKDLNQKYRIKPLGELAIRSAEKGNRSGALKAFKELNRVAEIVCDRQVQIKTVLNQAILFYKERDLKQSLNCFKKALELSLRSGEMVLRPAIWLGLATVYRLEGNFKKSTKLFWKVIRFRKIKPNFRINATCNLGEVYHLLGAGKKAIDLRKRAVGESRKFGDEYLELLSLFGLLSTEIIADKPHDKTLDETLKLAEKRGDFRISSGINYFLGINSEKNGRVTDARRYFGRAIAFACRAEEVDYHGGALLGIARSLLMENKVSEAVRILHKIQITKRKKLSWEFIKELRIWENYITAKKGGSDRAILSLYNIIPELVRCPELQALSLLIAAGLIQAQSSIPNAWVRFYLKGMDVLDRLYILGAKGSSRRIKSIIKKLFPNIFHKKNLPWAHLELLLTNTCFELFERMEDRFLLVYRVGKRIMSGRALASLKNCSSKDKKLSWKKSISGKESISSFMIPKKNAIMIVQGISVPDMTIIQSILEMNLLCKTLNEVFISKLKYPAAVYTDNTQKETDLIQSRAQAVQATKLLTISQRQKDPRFVGSSCSFKKIVKQLPQIASSDLPVLITGESGTGKDLLAEIIHKLKGIQKPFIAQHCGSLPEQLLEAELFGVKKGAFTGAFEDRPGLLHVASGGTLYLDGIDVLSKKLQAKFLRVLEDGSIRPVGGQVSFHVRFRLISASRVPVKDLKNIIREDFLYRINGFSLHIPPVRDRIEDLPVIFEELLRRWALRSGKPVPKIDKKVVDFLSTHSWPGNVRELENTIERALLNEPTKVTVKDLFFEKSSAKDEDALNIDRPLQSVREEAEKKYLLALLSHNKGRIGKSAIAANISRRHMLTLLKKHGLH